MSYRDELDAALARIATLERELERARRENAGDPTQVTALEEQLAAERKRAGKTAAAPPASTDARGDLFNVGVGLGFGGFAALFVGGMLWREEALPGYTLDNGYRAFGAIVALVGLVTFPIVRRRPRLAARAWAWTLGVVPVASIPLFLGAHAFNRLADSALPRDETAEVTAIEENPRHTEDHVTFRRQGHEPQSIHLFKPPGVGGSLPLIVHPGRLGWEWAEVRQRP